MKKLETLKNKSKETLIVRINWVKEEIKAWETFATYKAKELLKFYKDKFEKVELSEKKAEKKEEKKVEKKTTKKWE